MSHIALVIAAIIIQTPWSFTGAIILIIAHGLTSSALFCLANTNYERTHTRTLLLTRGFQAIIPLIGSWWLISNFINIALPPFPNLIGEIIIMTSLFNWSPWTIFCNRPRCPSHSMLLSIYVLINSTRYHISFLLIFTPISFSRTLNPPFTSSPYDSSDSKTWTYLRDFFCEYSITKILDCDSRDRS